MRSFQLILMHVSLVGDFVTRSNEVEIAYRRVDPNDWEDRGTCRLIDKTDNLSQDYRQVFTMDSAGGVKVEKFDQWVKRMPNGTVSASPDIVN